jgi:hypothetical protein
MQQGFKDIATRMENAADKFCATLVELGGCSATEAVKVFNLYLKNKVIKMDAVGGVYNVKHGAFLDRDVIRRAVEA